MRARTWLLLAGLSTCLVMAAVVVGVAIDRSGPGRWAHHSGATLVRPSPSYEAPAPKSSARPVSPEHLRHIGILVSEPRGKPQVTEEEAAQSVLGWSTYPSYPVAELYQVTVTGMGREDPTQPDGLDLLIEDRLVWIVTFPPKSKSLRGGLCCSPTLFAARSFMLMDALTGEFLLSQSLP